METVEYLPGLIAGCIFGLIVGLLIIKALKKRSEREWKEWMKEHNVTEGKAKFS